MKLCYLFLLTTFLLFASSEISYSDIYKYTDKEEKIYFYEYIDENGISVFVDSFDAIPEQYRKKAKIIKKPLPELPRIESKPADSEKGVVKKDKLKKTSEQSGISGRINSSLNSFSQTVSASINAPGAAEYIKIILIALLILVAFIFLKTLITVLKRQFQQLGDPLLEKYKTESERRSSKKNLEKKLAEKDYKGAAEIQQSLGEFEESAKLYLLAKEFDSAAGIFESLGNLEKAGQYYREAGNYTKAGEIYLTLKDYRNAAPMYEKKGSVRKAAELYENAGEYLRAAEIYETCFLKEGVKSPGSSGNTYALKSGQLFEKTGNIDRALQIYLKADLHNESAFLYEKKQDFIRAAEYYLSSDKLEKAAECFEKGGNAKKGNEIRSKLYYQKGLMKEAATSAEKAGQLIQAAEMYQEAGESLKAADIFSQSGYFNEAGENFLKVNDLKKAADAFEKGGNYIQAAKAYEKLGSTLIKVAELYEKGKGFFDAGRLYFKLGQIDRALNALQKVEAHSEDYTTASLLIGMLFLKKGMLKLAFEKFTKIIDNQPLNKSNIEPYYFLALCYEASGDREKAKSIYDRILIEDYTFRDVKERADKISKGSPQGPAG